MKKQITFTFDEKTIIELKEVSDKTLIPQSRLAEQAVKEIIKKESTKK